MIRPMTMGTFMPYQKRLRRQLFLCCIFYYFGQNGLDAVGREKIDGEMYYFDKNGSMAIGKRIIDGVEYNFDENGHVILPVEETVESIKDAVLRIKKRR